MRNAVAEWIAEGAYSRDVTVKTVYSDTNALETARPDLADVFVRAVVAEGIDGQRMAPARGKELTVVPLEIRVAGAVATRNTEDVDDLLGLTEEIRDRLRAVSSGVLHAATGDCHYVGSTIDPMAAPESVGEKLYAAFTITAQYVYENNRPS